MGKKKIPLAFTKCNALHVLFTAQTFYAFRTDTCSAERNN